MLLSKTVMVKWGSKNKKWYENKGYIFTKYKNEFQVKVEDLTEGSHVLVDVKCDGCNELIKVDFSSYNRKPRENDKYYCRKCAMNLYGKGKITKTKLKNGKSFEQWCIENNKRDILDRWDYDLNDCQPSEICYSTTKKYYFKCSNGLHKSELKQISWFTNGSYGAMNCNACGSFEQWCIENDKQDILDRWDYELNDCKPIQVHYGTTQEYYFKCPRGIHESELKNINTFTSGKANIICKRCNSFAQWGIDNLGEDFLEKYWDWDKNNELGINPWETSYGCNKKVYILCQEKSYHSNYHISCSIFSKGNRCPYCTNRNGKVHPLDSLGALYPQVLEIWSDKNKKSPYEYAQWSTQKAWWKCENGCHNEYFRSINTANKCDFRCPECQYSKGEKEIEKYLINNNIKYMPQKEFDGLIGLGNGNLSYDFYLPNHNLLIEYQGEQHEKYIKGFHKSKKDFEKQVEHDRRKREYAKQHNINLLEIWYYDFDNIEKILNEVLINKIA